MVNKSEQKRLGLVDVPAMPEAGTRVQNRRQSFVKGDERWPVESSALDTVLNEFKPRNHDEKVATIQRIKDQLALANPEEDITALTLSLERDWHSTRAFTCWARSKFEQRICANTPCPTFEAARDAFSMSRLSQHDPCLMRHYGLCQHTSGGLHGRCIDFGKNLNRVTKLLPKCEKYRVICRFETPDTTFIPRAMVYVVQMGGEGGSNAKEGCIGAEVTSKDPLAQHALIFPKSVVPVKLSLATKSDGRSFRFSGPGLGYLLTTMFPHKTLDPNDWTLSLSCSDTRAIEVKPGERTIISDCGWMRWNLHTGKPIEDAMPAPPPKAKAAKDEKPNLVIPYEKFVQSSLKAMGCPDGLPAGQTYYRSGKLMSKEDLDYASSFGSLSEHDSDQYSSDPSSDEDGDPDGGDCPVKQEKGKLTKRKLDALQMRISKARKVKGVDVPDEECRIDVLHACTHDRYMRDISVLSAASQHQGRYHLRIIPSIACQSAIAKCLVT